MRNYTKFEYSLAPPVRTDPYEDIANAIVVQACEDYKEYYKELKCVQAISTDGMNETALKRHNRKIERRKAKLNDVIDFFYSEWYCMLTRVNPQVILEHLAKEV